MTTEVADIHLRHEALRHEHKQNDRDDAHRDARSDRGSGMPQHRIQRAPIRPLQALISPFCPPSKRVLSMTMMPTRTKKTAAEHWRERERSKAREQNRNRNRHGKFPQQTPQHSVEKENRQEY